MLLNVELISETENDSESTKVSQKAFNETEPAFGAAEFLVFEDENEVVLEEKPCWKVLIVDDEPEIHSVTKMALKHFEFDERKIEFTSAFSAAEAKQILSDVTDFALVLLDVVMESDDAGLTVVDFIRNELQNKYVRIVLRTGQPGVAPEEIIVTRYDIDDYKAKTDLTAQKLITTVVSSFRAYRELQRIDSMVQQRTNEIMTLHDEITDSIMAAQRIQTAILPSHDFISQQLPNFFVFYKPKDIVSGDLYWFSQVKGQSIIANIDCTGHGVPGAIISVFAFNLLNQIVEKENIINPAHILNRLDSQIRDYLNKGGNLDADSTFAYGMDMSVLAIDHASRRVRFAGANHTAYVFQSEQLIEVRGDHMPIGKSFNLDKQFTLHSFHINAGDRLYLFTDGIIDQFGGEHGKKYTSKRLKEFLSNIQENPLEEQFLLLEKEFFDWKKSHPQTDDVCFIGLQIV